MRKRKERMSEGKKNIIAALLQEYDIQSAEDIQDDLKTIYHAPYYLLYCNQGISTKLWFLYL